MVTSYMPSLARTSSIMKPRSVTAADLTAALRPPAKTAAPTKAVVDDADFAASFGAPSSVQKPYDPNDEPNPKNPGGVSNNQLKQTMQANRTAAETSTTRERNIAGGHLTGAKPSYFGLSLDPATADEAARYKAEATAARKKRDGGFLGDLGRLGLYGAGAFANPVGWAVEDYLPEGVNSAVNWQRNIGDELGDQLIPGGSGAMGGNVVPGVNSGGDKFYPSETIQSGSYEDGYRGIGNPRVPIAGDGSGAGSGGTGTGTGTGGPPVVGPGGQGGMAAGLDDDIRALLAQERGDQGPSEAEALLNKAADRIQAQSLGVAAGARGGAGARERAQREAVSTNAALGSQATQDVAQLRAQEERARKGREMAIMDLLARNSNAADTNALGWGNLGGDIYRTDRGVDIAKIGAEAANRRIDIEDRTFLDNFQHDPVGALMDMFGLVT